MRCPSHALVKLVILLLAPLGSELRFVVNKKHVICGYTNDLRESQEPCLSRSRTEFVAFPNEVNSSTLQPINLNPVAPQPLRSNNSTVRRTPQRSPLLPTVPPGTQISVPPGAQ